MIVLVIHVLVQISLENFQIILNYKYLVGAIDSLEKILLLNLVPPTIQREPNEDNISVIQHHHIALTCTANGWDIIKKIVFKILLVF